MIKPCQVAPADGFRNIAEGSMEYPRGFPKHLQPPVDAAIAEADIEFVKAKKRLRFSCFGNDHAVDKLIVKFVEKVFFVLAQQARKAVADGLWSGEQIRSALDDSVHKLVVNAYHQKNSHGGALLNLIESDATWRMEQDIKESEEWLEHQKELASIVKAQAAPDGVRRPIPKKFGNGRCKGPAPTQAVSMREGSKGSNQDQVAAERVALLQAYQAEGAKRGVRITDRMIAKAARPTWNDRTPVQRWKRNDPRCTHRDDSAIRAVLNSQPHLR